VAAFIRMRRDLVAPIEPAVWPPGFSPCPFDRSQAPALHTLLAQAYADGGGAIGPMVEWRAALFADPEFDPDSIFLARGPSGALAGAVHAWTGGFIKDVAVDRAARRRGLASALLLTAFAEYRRRGFGALDLKVRPDNGAAIQLYGSLGMAPAPAHA
jgi:ribosomal protein S18 acetylase RimI-like enzyme